MKQNPDHIARQSQQFDPEPRRVEWLSWDDLTPAGRNLVRFCAFCTAAVLAMLIGMFVHHLMTKFVASFTQIGGAPW